MGKKIKKGTKGSAKLFITRSQALKKLQITLQDFRRLCILKGIYPRDPKHKPKGNDKIYFHIKDIKFLANEKLLDKFRDIRAYMKKIKKTKDRGDKSESIRLTNNVPTYSIAHLVKERYPTLTEALKDIDDALSLVYLFATFPTHQKLGISNEHITTCTKLSKQFEVFVMASKSLRKSFLSIKGIYYQCEIMGVPILYLVPYKFSQRLTFEVDYSIMNTFIEFYETLLKFVLYKLYSELGISYPPAFLNDPSELSIVQNQAEILALQKKVESKFKDEISIPKGQEEAEETKKLRNTIEDSLKAQSIFKNCKVFLNRETPIESLAFTIISSSGVIAFDHSTSTISREDSAITHEISDRPASQVTKIQGRDYIQPQWVYDSFNHRVLLPIHEYAIGAKLPPHLSPFVESGAEDYVPKRLQEIKSLKGEEVPEAAMETEDKEVLPSKKVKEEVETHEEEEDEVKEKKAINRKKEIEKMKMEMGKTLVTKKGREALSSMERAKQKKKIEAQKLLSKKKKLSQQK